MTNNDLDTELRNTIYEMVERIQELNRIRLAEIEPRLENVIRNRVTDERIVEQLLDELLDCAGISEEGLLPFKRLCRYFFPINLILVTEYINIYRELYDSDDNQEGEDD
jgi:pilus assembly protein TadC